MNDLREDSDGKSAGGDAADGGANIPVVIHDFIDEMPDAAHGRPWLNIWPPQVHRTQRRARRGPFRGRVQMLVEDSRPGHGRRRGRQ
jgi:hypothetical protein